jgi:molecular chaperone DnaK
MKIGEAMYKADPAAGQSPPGGGAGPQGGHEGPGDDKVVDAEFEEVDDKKKSA